MESTHNILTELAAFLSNIEQIFIDTIRKLVYANLRKDARKSLSHLRKTRLFSPQGDLVLQLQEQSCHFVNVDKNAYKTKAKEQIDRISFI